MKRFFTFLGLSLFLFSGAQAQNFQFEVEEFQVHSIANGTGIAALDGMTTYRLYISGLGATDFISSVYGNDQEPFTITALGGLYNSPLNASWSASGISPVFVSLFPEMEYDSYATIGLTQSAATSGIIDAADPSIVEDPLSMISPIFLNDASTGGTVSSVTGFAYYVLNGNPVGLPDVNGRVQVMQLTSSGTISGTVNVQIFPNGVGSNFTVSTYVFDGVGVYAAVGACVLDTDGDGICDADEIVGCQDPTACSYDPTATDPGICDYIDTDGDGVCDANEILGCTDATACNYDPAATDDNGLCTVLDACGVCGGDDSSCSGCGIEFACNYDVTAIVIDNTLCEYLSCAGCMDMTACNYDATATFDDGTNCVFAVTYYDCAGVCLADTDGDGVCDELEIVGCSDMTACNYNVDATDTDNTLCSYAVEFYDCFDVCINDTDGDGVCDEFEVLGCTDMTACNFNETATDDDGTCDFSCFGCTDPTATNYNIDATVDDGSCCFLTLTFTTSDPLCNGALGSITVVAFGATGLVTYSSEGVSNETGTFNVMAGIHNVTATDANGCSFSADITLVDPDVLTLVASATAESAGTPGVGTATATGGTLDYVIVWTDATGAVVDAAALAAGDYTVTVTDANGCVATVNVTVAVDGIEVIDPLVFGMYPNPTTGSVTIQVPSLIENVSVRVLDGLGRIVWTQDAMVLQGATVMNFSDLATGTYTIMLSNDLGVSVRRLSIQR